MLAAVIHRLGDLPRLDTFAEPVAGADEVLVRVAAAAIKPHDLALARGHHHCSPLVLPAICGTDGVGYLDTGERVYFSGVRAPYGALAALAPARCVAMIPDDVDNVTAAAIVDRALMAWLPLRWRARIAPGETVLVVGASGPLGQMTVRAARLLGAARVVVAGRGTAELEALGADAVIDLRLPPTHLHEAFASHAVGGIDVVVDFIWGPISEVLIAALSVTSDPGERGVRIVSTGELMEGPIELAGAHLRDAPIQLMGDGPGNRPSLRELETMIEEILGHVATGALRADAEVMPLTDIADAWARAQASDRERAVVVRVG